MHNKINRLIDYLINSMGDMMYSDSALAFVEQKGAILVL